MSSRTPPCDCLQRVRADVLLWLESEPNVPTFTVPCAATVSCSNLGQIFAACLDPFQIDETHAHILDRGKLTYHTGNWHWCCADRRTGAFMSGPMHVPGEQRARKHLKDQIDVKAMFESLEEQMQDFDPYASES